MPTTKLGLPTITGNQNADVVRDLNGLAEAIDSKTGVAEGFAQLGKDGKVPTAQLPTISKKAADIEVVDADNHFTGTNVESVLAELFTFANSGKTDIASVIGSPATSGDTFAQLKTHIQDSKNTLATNLTAKGQAAIGSETLAVLAAKVSNISAPKQASGFATADATSQLAYQFSNVTGGSANGFSLEIRGLSFTPKLVYIARNDAAAAVVASLDTRSPLYSNGKKPFYSALFGATPASLEGNAVIYPDGFRLPLYSNSSRYPLYWVASE